MLGLSFKPETDDMRDAPSLAILPALMEKGARVRAHDPKGMDEARALLPEGVEFFGDIYETLDGADGVVLMTEWNAYRGLDLENVARRMAGNVFVDLRNVYDRSSTERQGFHYVGVGR